MTEAPIAVVGAGMAGLACARRLFAAHRPVTVLEKSRRLGGRLATRRTAQLSFDYGAQYIVAREPALQDYLDLAASMGYAQAWMPMAPELSRVDPWMVGVPGMSALLQPLAAGLDVRRALRVTACIRRDDQWWLASEAQVELGPFAALVLAVPAPQAARLLEHSRIDVEFASRLRDVRMAPCWALMAGFQRRFDVSADVLQSADAPLAWAARDVGKPGRHSAFECWVLQASADWSRTHLEDSSAAVAEALLLEFERLVGPAPRGPWLDAHLWRHARVEQALGEPCLWEPALQLGLCGDWCIDARAEAAWQSGTALAARMM